MYIWLFFAFPFQKSGEAEISLGLAGRNLWGLERGLCWADLSEMERTEWWRRWWDCGSEHSS